MGEWITIAEALKTFKITKPTLYKYIWLWKIVTEIVKNKLFIDKKWLKEYIENRRKYWWKAVDSYVKWLFDDNNVIGKDKEENETVDKDSNSQNRLATVTVWWLGKMIEDLQWLIQSKDLLLEKKNKTITRLSSIMWLLIWLFMSLVGLFIYLYILWKI